MRILLCAPYELSAARGNSVAAQRLSRGFARRGHQVEVLHGRESQGAAGMGVGVAERCRAFGPDVALVMHAWRCAAAFEAIHACGGLPVVVSLRGTDLNEMIDEPVRGPVVRSVLDACDAITVFHDRARAELAARCGAWAVRTRVVPNGANLPASSVDYRSKLGIGNDAVVFVTLGGLRAVKRPLWLVEALSQVRERCGRVAYLHAGPALEQDVADRFRSLVQRHSWLHDAGVVPHREVDSLLRAGDVYVSASRSEGMPHAVREAMLAGLPLLLSDNDGHRSMATEGTEALFFNSQDAFVSEATRLIVDQELRARFGRGARKRASSMLDQGSGEIDAYLGLFDELLAAASGHELPDLL